MAQGTPRLFAYQTPTRAWVSGETSKMKTLSAFSPVKDFQRKPEATNDR